MAKPDIITLQGKVGNLVFYTWKTKPVIRSRPGIVNQGKGTRKAAGLFGKASVISRVIRSQLADALPDRKDISMRLRLNTAIFQWLRARESDAIAPLKCMDKFEFNEKFPLSSRLKKYPSLNWSEQGKLHVEFPSLNVKEDFTAPVSTSRIFVTLMLTGCNREPLIPVKLHEYTIEIDYVTGTIPARSISSEIEAENSLLVACMGLRYEVDGRMNTDVRWMPVSIVGSYNI